MRNFILAIVLLITATSIAAQDTVKYGNPRYMFNQRHHVLMCETERSLMFRRPGSATELLGLNDTSVMPYTPIQNGSGNITDSSNSKFYFSFGYHTDKQIKIYGISAPLIMNEPDREDYKIVALVQMNNGQLQKLYSSNNVTRRNLFLHEGDYLKSLSGTNNDTTYVGRYSTLTYTYEFYFDSAITVHDTFFVGIHASIKWLQPITYQATHIEHYDSIGYPTNPDDEFHYDDFHMFAQIAEYSNVIDFYDYWVDVHGVWEAVFPIIKPLDSLGLCEIVEEPEVYLAPNPASGSATLTSDVPVSRLLMHNVDGRLVRDLSPNATRVEIDLAGLPGGLYILSTVTPFGTAHRKLIVR